ncbi:MAG TPA: hypothetical protein VNW29_06970 [Candidatus Sulfotelmatobacter sp.]|jgi:hypothetical protein|nr:hypothetical protein [Candidatus Sulfotelmatobacter sp.]
MTFQDIPLLFEILTSENLTPVSSHPEGDRIVCEDASGNKFFMKDCRGIEEKMFNQVFPAIRSQNLNFTILELPDFKNVVSRTIQPGQQRDFIFVNYYDGTTFNESWNETHPHGYGGRALDISFAEKVLKIVQDFSLINLTTLAPFNLPTFDFSVWKNDIFPLLSANLIQNGSLTQDHINKADTILSSANIFQHSQTILTNGDFYPRNFIELSSGKIVVIDWEGRGREHIRLNGGTHAFASQRNAFLNYIENHAAFFFVHMWGNHAVQKKFMTDITQAFNLTADDIQAAILIKSLEQGAAFGGGFLSHREAEIFVHALELDYINDFIQ